MHLGRTTVLAAAAAFAWSFLGATVGEASNAAPTYPSLAQLKADVAASSVAFTMPNLANAIPPLGTQGANEAQPYPPRPACFLQPNTFAALPSNPEVACGFGDPAAHRTILLWGDSHAAMFAPAVDVMGKLLHWRVVAFSMFQCAPWLDPNAVDYFGNSTADCNRFRRRVIAFAIHAHPAVLLPIGVDGYWGRSKFPSAVQLATEMERLIVALKPSHAKIVLMGATPFWFFDPSQCLATVSDPRKCERSPSQLIRKTEETGFALAAKASRLSLLDPTPLLCTPSRCPLFVKGADGTRLVYADRNHLYREYAAWIGLALGQLMAPRL